MESLFRCCLCVCGILPLLDADGTQHSSIIPDVTSRVCFFFHLSSALHPFFFTHIRSSPIPSWMAPARCTTVHTLGTLFFFFFFCMCQSIFFFFFSLSLLHLFVCSFLSFMFVCDVRRYIQQLREAMSTAHTHGG
jgi:hypothetical protein